jgi:N-acetylmuramic acid 6-phosphate etherase
VTELDRLPTEQINPRTVDIDRLDTLGILERLNAEDQLVAMTVRSALPDIGRAIDAAAERWQRGGRVVLFGAGTSGRLALLDAAELGPTFGVPAERYQARLAGGPAAFWRAVEGAEDDRLAGVQAASDLGLEDVAFGITASGRTPWVLGALDRAADQGAYRVGLACVPLPAMAALVDVSVVVETGPEAISGSTRLKAGTAQKLVLNAFSTGLMIRLGKVYGNLMVDVRASNAKLQHRAVRLVQQAAEVEPEIAEATLRAAGWDVKRAIAMLRLGVSAEDAGARLAQHGGRLRDVLAGGAGEKLP